MNISLQNVDSVSAVLTVQIEKADYQEKVEKALKTLRQKVNMPGFRKGMVPAGLIKKQYGVSVLAEEIDKLLQEKVFEYIRENKVNMLGTPLPKENQVNFETEENFEFSFDIALAPEFNVELSANDSVDYYDINVTDEMVDQQVKMYTQRTAKYEKVEDYQDNDMLKGLLAELDENGNTKEGGVQVEGAVMMPVYMKNDEQKAIFNGAKTNTVLVFNPSVAFDNNEAELASLLKLKKEEVADHKGNFSFQIEEITRMIPGELTQELFDQVLGEGKAHSEEEFRAQIKEKLVAANDIKVEQGDLTNMAKEATRAQFAQYGMINVPEELLENYSKEMLKKQESVEALLNRVVESKLSETLKGQVTLNHKAVSAEEFNQMFQ